MLSRVIDASAFRRTGADLPFGDPRPSHDAVMEGYYWRFTDVRAGRVAVALCGVNRSPTGTWGTVALALSGGSGGSGGGVRSAAVPSAAASTDHFHVRAGAVMEATEDRVRVDLGDVARLDVRLSERFGWPLALGGGGVASGLPYLSGYWSPHLLGARVEGTVELGGERLSLDGATAYAEKNWGTGFPPQWWWGQAQGFDRDDVCVAFSGGHVGVGTLLVRATSVVVRVGDEVVRLAPPSALVRAEVGGGRWRVRARSPLHRVEVTGDVGTSSPHVLPVPLPAERRNSDTLQEYLTATVHVRFQRGGRLVYEGRSGLAGLEAGALPGHAPP